MPSEKGLIIDNVYPGSLAEKLGLLPGDILLSINSHKLRDSIDFLFYSNDENLEIKLDRKGEKFTIHTVRKDNAEFGLDFKPFKVMTCKNNCIFCFVKQLPKGLRKTLYIKDEDYRLSFLYGNYITLTNMGKEDRKRIVEQRLSPLYISVHTTNRTLRNQLIGNAKAPDIMKELKFFSDNKIKFNVQIVLCPDYNDGKELQRTLNDLSIFYPYVMSIAVVPVGVTVYRKHDIRAVEKNDADRTIEIIESYQKKFRRKYGDLLVYGADELYLKAGHLFLPFSGYGELHQLENGVGMIPWFMHCAKKIKHQKIQSGKKILTFTGLLFYPFLKKFIESLTDNSKLKIIDVIPVENRFFGASITVAGLLTGRDVIKTLLGKSEGSKIILVPDVVLNDEDKFLDDVTLKDMEEAIGIPVRKIKSTPEGLLKGILE
ncbi:MAG: DUF512 domain-containing protein [Nitrospirota bacterium]